MLDDAVAAERLRRALESVRGPTNPADNVNVDLYAMRHLLDEYTVTVQRLRAAVRDAEARLRNVAKDLKVGARVVRRERARVDPPVKADET